MSVPQHNIYTPNGSGPNRTVPGAPTPNPIPGALGLGLNMFFNALQFNEYVRARRAVRTALLTAISRLDPLPGHYVYVLLTSRQVGNDVRSMRLFNSATVGQPRPVRTFTPPNYLWPPEIIPETVYIHNMPNQTPAFPNARPISLTEASDLAERLNI